METSVLSPAAFVLFTAFSWQLGLGRTRPGRKFPPTAVITEEPHPWWQQQPFTYRLMRCDTNTLTNTSDKWSLPQGALLWNNTLTNTSDKWSLPQGALLWNNTLTRGGPQMKHQHIIFVTLDHKTSHKGLLFLLLRFYTSSESWINKLSIYVWFVRIGHVWLRYNYLKIWNLRVQKNQNFEKIAFKVVQMKFLAMHITNQKLSFDIFTIGNLQNIFMGHDLYLIS